MNASSVLVLGATGIIGRELCRVATERGFDVYAVSRGQHKANAPQHSQLKTLVADVYNAESLRNAIGDRTFDSVIDLLSFTPAQLKQTLGVLRGRFTQYFFVSSATIYDGAERDELITEDSPGTSIPWNYPKRKIACENFIRQEFQSIDDAAYTIVRPYITYSDQRIPFGAWETGDIIVRLQNGLPIPIPDSIIDTSTTLTHATDLAVGIIGLAGNPNAFGEAFHVVSEESLTWREVHEVAAEILKVTPDTFGVPTDNVVNVLPELEGKIADRSLSRRFSVEKLRSISPDSIPKTSVREGFTAALESRLSYGQLWAGQQGYLDRIVATERKAGRSYWPIARQSGASGILRYAAARSRALTQVKRGLSTVSRRRRSYT